MDNKRRETKGRGSQINPPHRFGGPYREPDPDQADGDEDDLARIRRYLLSYKLLTDQITEEQYRESMDGR